MTFFFTFFIIFWKSDGWTFRKTNFSRKSGPQLSTKTIIIILPIIVQLMSDTRNIEGKR